MEPSLIPDVSREAIQDKSKASALAKTIVCLQALWFCVQCITRLTQNLSISLLELNTFAHALCAFVIYSLWWSKPLDVDEPLLLQGEELEKMVAVLVMLNILSAGPKEFTYQAQFSTRQRDTLGRAKISYDIGQDLVSEPRDGHIPKFVAPYEAEPEGSSSEGTPDYELADFASFRKRRRQSGRDQGPESEGWTFLTKGHQLHGFRVVTKPVEGNSPRPVLTVRLSASDVRCMKLASEYMAHHPEIGGPQDDESVSRPHLVVRAKNWPSLGSWDSSGVHLHSKAILVGFTFAGLVYGMIRLSAWNAPFPSTAQMWLWRASAITLISSPLILVIGLMGDYDASDDDFCSMFCSPFSFAFMVIGALRYVMACTYLVVECFIGITHLPADAFMVPHWSRYFPHIG